MNKSRSTAYRHPRFHSELQLKSSGFNDNNINGGYFQDAESDDIFDINNGIPDFTYPMELSKIDKETKQLYENLANDYDKFAEIPFKTFKTSEKEVRTNITEKLCLKQNSAVLEVGAGDGRGSEYIAQKLGKKGSFFVQELSPAFLNKAIERLKPYENKTNIEYSIASAMYLPFEDNFFDVAHHFGGFNNFSEPERALKELARVVKPGGKVVIGDESMAPWLRNTQMGKIMMNSNPLLKYEIPFDKFPVELRDVKIEWIMMGAFFILEFTVGEGEPEADYFVPIPSERGGNHWIRYYGHLEGVTDKTKKIAYEAQKKSGKSMHRWLDDVVKNAADKELNK